MTRGSRYYEEELNYLIEAGSEYARAHPERARYLNIRDPRARDPHVERLIEAFAFLAGNIRQRLDDDFPELTHALIDLIWPHYLRPLPPMALLELRPIPGMVRERQVVPRGFLVDSRPTSREVSCRFRTAYPVEILPIRLDEAGVVTGAAGGRLLRLRFALLEGADPGKLILDRVRLAIIGEPATAFGIYRTLRQAVDSVVLRLAPSRERVLPAAAVQPVGFGEGEEILPYPATSFPGYRLLSEYFTFPEKFLFVDLVGLGPLDLDKGAKGFEIEVRFRTRPPDSFRPSTDSFRLFVTPIVNLFPRDGEPILVTQRKTAYRVLGDFSHPDAYEVISVDGVEGMRQADGRRRTHEPFYSFTHGRSEDSEITYYHASSGFSPAGSWVTHLSLVSPAAGRLPGEETLSLQLTCMNGRLCGEVGVEDIRVPGGERLGFVTFRNITRPTAPIYPRLGEGAEWSFISHMALNSCSLSDAAALRAVLSLYDVGDLPANRRRIESITGVRASGCDVLLRGTPVRGTEVRLSLDESYFDDDGDLLLFAEVLSQFLALYASVNSFSELVIERAPSGEVLRCPPRLGKQTLL